METTSWTGSGTQPLQSAGELPLSARTPADGHGPLARAGVVAVREDAGPALAVHQPYGVEPVLAEMAAQRDLGVLDGHRVRRAAAQPVEVEPTGLVRAGDLDRRVRLEPAVVEPLGQHHHVGREPVAADVRDLPRLLGVAAVSAARPVGRARRSRRRDVRGCRRRRADPSSGAQAGASPRGDGVRGRASSSSRGVGERSSRGSSRRRDADEDAEPAPRWARWCRRISSTLALLVGSPVRAAPTRRAGGRRAGALIAPRAVVLDEQQRGARGWRCPARSSARLGGREHRKSPRRPSRGVSDDLEQTLADQPTAQHQAGLRVEGEVGRRELAERADLLDRRRRSAPARSPAGRRAAPASRSPRSSSTHGWPGRRRSRVSPAIVVAAASGRAARRAGGPRRGLEEGVGSRSSASRRRRPVAQRRRQPASRSASPSASSVRVVEVAGRQVVVGVDLVQHRRRRGRPGRAR